MDAIQMVDAQIATIRPTCAKLQKTYELLGADGSVFRTFKPAEWAATGQDCIEGFEQWPHKVMEWLELPPWDYEAASESRPPRPPQGCETEDFNGVPHVVQYVKAGGDRIKVLMSTNMDPQTVDQIAWSVEFPKGLLAYETDGAEIIVLSSVKDPD